tara:strand:- start:41 stop:271 length:231 start_codon:yes stop_codon:yes gene_type:complete
MVARDYYLVYMEPELGTLTVVIPAWDDPTRIIENDDDFLDFIQLKDIPEGVTSHRVLMSEIAQLNGYFRDAWEWED